MRNEDGRCGAGYGGHPVMFSYPKTLVTETLDLNCRGGRFAKGSCRRRTGGDRREIKYGKRDHEGRGIKFD